MCVCISENDKQKSAQLNQPAADAAGKMILGLCNYDACQCSRVVKSVWCVRVCASIHGVKYSIEASSSINTGVETSRSHLAD